ncbi:MAG: DNA repair protein RecO [Cyclobacteriaceae bacterium]|nr:DNA repair protein RecO [Cyclobacteriaceae bacterium]
MLYKTRGIALSFIRYKETSIIARVYTEAFGMQSYIVNSVRSKTAKTKIALFQPLTLLDLVVYHQERRAIHRISEMKCNHSFQTIPFNIKKTAIALFITELIGQALFEEQENEALFSFMHESIVALDEAPEKFENFHIQFMMVLSKYLGIKPETSRDMLLEVGHLKMYDREFIDKVDFFVKSGFGEHIRLIKSERNDILKLLIDYYRYHYDAIREFKSIHVLREVLG